MVLGFFKKELCKVPLERKIICCVKGKNCNDVKRLAGEKLRETIFSFSNHKFYNLVCLGQLASKPQIPRLNWEATHCTWLWRPLAATLCLVRHLGCQMSNNFQSVYYTTSLFPNSNQGNGMKKGTNLESSSREMHYGNLVFSPIELHRRHDSTFWLQKYTNDVMIFFDDANAKARKGKCKCKEGVKAHLDGK